MRRRTCRESDFFRLPWEYTKLKLCTPLAVVGASDHGRRRLVHPASPRVCRSARARRDAARSKLARSCRPSFKSCAQRRCYPTGRCAYRFGHFMIVSKTHSLFATMRLPKTEAPLPLSSLVTFAARYVSCPGHGLELNPRLNSKLNLTLNQHDTYLGPGHGLKTPD